MEMFQECLQRQYSSLAQPVSDMPCPLNSIQNTSRSGYIGGSVLERLRKQSIFATFHISVLVRDREKARKLQTIIGVNVIIGSYSDHDMLAELASQADVVFSCVKSPFSFLFEHLPSVIDDIGGCR